jgi:hypothetical protein
VSFALGKEIKQENKGKMVQVMQEIHEKTTGTPFCRRVHPARTNGDLPAGEYPQEDN